MKLLVLAFAVILGLVTIADARCGRGGRRGGGCGAGRGGCGGGNSQTYQVYRTYMHCEPQQQVEPPPMKKMPDPKTDPKKKPQEELQ